MTSRLHAFESGLRELETLGWFGMKNLQGGDGRWSTNRWLFFSGETRENGEDSRALRLIDFEQEKGEFGSAKCLSKPHLHNSNSQVSGMARANSR